MSKLKQLLNKVRNDNSHIYVYIIAFGLFVTPYLLRQQLINPFSERTYLWALNYIAFFGLSIFLLQNIINKKANIWYVFPVLSILALLPTQLSHPISWGVIFVFCCCCIYPQYILFLDLSTYKRDDCIRYFLTFLDCIIFLLFITAFIDKVADRFVVKQLAIFFSCDESVTHFAYQDGDYNRFFSIYGHPLTNAFLFNFCYALNVLYNKYHKNLLPNYVWAIVSLFSLVCCGSKTGITVGIIITILIFFKKWQFYVLVAVSIPIAYMSGILDNIIYRFTKLPLTTGRAFALQTLIADKSISFHLFQGYGSLLNTEFSGHTRYLISIASEFPLIDHIFYYGTLFALLLLLPPFFYITLRLWKEKRFFDWFLWCLLYAEINTYNGFSSRLDISFTFYFLSFILLNVTTDTDFG